MKIENARMLVVDDDEIMRSFVISTLRRMGIQNVESCPDGASALKLVPAFKPDLVLTDIHMEPMGGIEFVSKLRRHPSESMRNTRVIFMSADASKSTLEEALPLGSFGYIVKPPRPESLRSKLEMALRQ